jgi:uncharacterized membrane protein YqjE
MTSRPPSSPDPRLNGQPPRLLVSLRELLLTVLGMAQTRLALAGVELEENLHWLSRLLLGAVGLLVFVLVGLLTLTALLVMVVDASQRITVLAVLAGLYLAAAVWFYRHVLQTLSARPVFLQATLAAMAQDRDALKAATTPDVNGQARHE